MGIKENLISDTSKEVPGTDGRYLTWYKAASSHVGLFITLIIYTVIGGLIFRQLEYPAEEARLVDLERTLLLERKALLESFFNATPDDQLQQLLKYEGMVQEVGRGGLTLPLTNTTPNPRWSLLQAIFFASTVLTTIGYGNITPSTWEGRLFCIMFALIGIPLTVSVMADLGAVLASTLPSIPDTRGLKRSLASAVAATSILLLYIAVGSALFISWEESWTFFDGFYFCFVTMTTIGFGDLVPSTPQYMLLCTVYILLGLSLTSTIIELVRQQYSRSWRHLQALAETLAHMAAEPSGADLHADLRRVVAVINFNKERHCGWEEAVKQLKAELSSNKCQEQPTLVQFIVYESSV